MKLKSRILVGLSIFLLCVCASAPNISAMWSETSETDDAEVPLNLGGVGAVARDSLCVGIDSLDPQNQLFVASLAGDIGRLSSLVEDTRVHTRIPDTNGDTMWHILIREHKWSVIAKLLGGSGGKAVSPAVIKHCQISFAQCITKRNNQGRTPLDLAHDDGVGALLRNCMPANWSVKLPGTFPPELRRFK